MIAQFARIVFPQTREEKFPRKKKMSSRNASSLCSHRGLRLVGLKPRTLTPVVVLSSTQITSSSPRPPLLQEEGIHAAGGRIKAFSAVTPTTTAASGTSAAAAGQQAASGSESITGGCFDATLVVDGLYLGDYSDASSADAMHRRHIRRILNMAAECAVPRLIEDAFLTKHVPLRDHSDEDIETHFASCIAFIHEGLCAGEGVLVHCRKGVSRSATIVLAYLMRFGISAEIAATSPRFSCVSYTAAFAFLKNKRPSVCPNFGFCLALRSLDVAHGLREDVWCDGGDDEQQPWAFHAMETSDARQISA
jgi:hypothetical protein